MAHSSAEMHTTRRLSCRTASGGTRDGQGYQTRRAPSEPERSTLGELIHDAVRSAIETAASRRRAFSPAAARRAPSSALDTAPAN